MQYWIKKNKTYIFVSIALAIFFLTANYLAKEKVSKTTEKLINRFIRDNIQNKKNIFKHDFNQFNLYNSRKHIETIVKSSKNKQELINHLLHDSEECFHSKNVNDSFIFRYKKNNILDTLYFKSKKKIKKNLLQLKNDTVFTVNDKVYLQKITFYSIDSLTKIAVGHTIDLHSYWRGYSNNLAKAYYTILTDKKGVCLLHPDPKYIGKKSEIFNAISISEVNKSSEILKVKQQSNFLKVDVYRFLDIIKSNNQNYILIENYPIDIFFKEQVSEITTYFSWINFLGLLTFILVFMFFQQRLLKEFNKNLKQEGEKQELDRLNEQYKEKNTLLQLNQLKKIMNPHFLFNSLNSLSVLVDLNQELSKKFILKLADVYRYFLTNRKHGLTTVKKELEFLEQYFFLHKIRFNESIELNIHQNCLKTSFQKKIPFLSLEILVENALKHNRYSKLEPLKINCTITDGFIIVSNNYNPIKSRFESHKIGLHYLKNCYEFYHNTEFKVSVINGEFICHLPLLTS